MKKKLIFTESKKKPFWLCFHGHVFAMTYLEFDIQVGVAPASIGNQCESKAHINEACHEVSMGTPSTNSEVVCAAASWMAAASFACSSFSFSMKSMAQYWPSSAAMRNSDPRSKLPADVHIHIRTQMCVNYVHECVCVCVHGCS